MLDGDLLLPSAVVVIEPFRQHHDGAGGLVGELQVFRPRLEKLQRLPPALLIHRQRGLVRRHQLRDQYSLDGISRRHIHHTVRDGQTCFGDAIVVFRVSDRQRVEGLTVEPIVPLVRLTAAQQFKLALRDSDLRQEYEIVRARDLMIEFIGGEPGEQLRDQFA